VFFSHRERARNPVVYRALADAGIDIALRGGLLRLSPHLYNSPADIDRALAVLNTSAY
jgi:selenocysteine lyase/cysteine desulfurase